MASVAKKRELLKLTKDMLQFLTDEDINRISDLYIEIATRELAKEAKKR